MFAVRTIPALAAQHARKQIACGIGDEGRAGHDAAQWRNAGQTHLTQYGNAHQQAERTAADVAHEHACTREIERNECDDGGRQRAQMPSVSVGTDRDGKHGQREKDEDRLHGE
jgi:hypothetical protein